MKIVDINRSVPNRSIVQLLLVLALSSADASERQEPSRTLDCDHIIVFVSKTCPHCAAAKTYLSELKVIEARLEIDYREITQDLRAREEFIELNEQHGIARPAVPTFDICGRVIVGFNETALRNTLYGQGTADQIARAEIPLFGAISPATVGLPAFTIALGLVDGFNPCAMWVLLFLLSILVNVRRRSRIIMVAGTFVLISGITNFSFMVAWLNAFLIIGYSRALQVVLGTIAILVGSVHLKDFVALHRGISLSIPDSVKPKLYDRIRRVIRAENLPIALGGTVVLAIMINFVELLCTAGLPALYTQILSNYPLSDAAYYGYLVLYNVAYIADDSVMVTIAIVTLGDHRLQERQARWLKLLSGGFIIILGGVLILAPEVFLF